MPIRGCTPWCTESPEAHAKQHPEDRSRWPTFRIVPQSEHRPSQYADGTWRMAYLNVYLRRLPDRDDALVYIHSEETDAELRLTLGEARDLIDYLVTLVDTAEGRPGQACNHELHDLRPLLGSGSWGPAPKQPNPGRNGSARHLLNLRPSLGQ
ncbi:hypothetical protein [Nocardioides sp. MH1]|uniref:DUF6907 domain-containing protein n=1 Tax=Nocardioides sp. MH1 TaxID=3242490 RepID=UPI003522D6E6